MVVTVVVLDACILISLSQVNRFDILTSLTDYSFVTTEHVLKEIIDERQSKDVQAQVETGTISVVRLLEPSTLRLYFQLRDRIGSGEASCIAIAQESNWLICSDDKRKVPAIAEKHLGAEALLTFEKLLRIASDISVIDAVEASEIQEELAEISRMKLAIKVVEDL